MMITHQQEMIAFVLVLKNSIYNRICEILLYL